MTLHGSEVHISRLNTEKRYRCSEYIITSNILLHINDTTITMAQYGHREDARNEKVRHYYSRLIVVLEDYGTVDWTANGTYSQWVR